MTYQTTNPHAINHPLRSIPMFRPVQALGAAFYANHVGDAAMARMVAEMGGLAGPDPQPPVQGRGDLRDGLPHLYRAVQPGLGLGDGLDHAGRGLARGGHQ